MKPRLISTSLFNTFDLVMTMILVSLFGLGIEANPIGGALFSNNILLFLVTIVVVNLMLIVLYRLRHYKIARVGSWIVFVVYGGLTLYHVVGMVFLF